MTITIISGASRGIGAAIASDLIKLDYIFLLLSKHNTIKLARKNKNVYQKQIDFEYYNQVDQLVSSFVQEKKLDNNENIKQLNIILCASQLGTGNFDLNELNSLYKSNVIGNIAVILSACELCNKNTKIRIVFFAGGGAAFPFPEFLAYSLSKVATVRAVENLSVILKGITDDLSVIALAPGAVNTNMLKKVIQSGSKIRTRTDISEPVNFVRKFITDQFNSPALNGMFLHVRDDLGKINDKKDIYKLRRIE